MIHWKAKAKPNQHIKHKIWNLINKRKKSHAFGLNKKFDFSFICLTFKFNDEIDK